MEATLVDRTAGISPARERFWGIIGGTIGALFGVGAALVATVLDGIPWIETGGMYPARFEQAQWLYLDGFLLFGLVVGTAFGVAALVYARRGSFPRTDTYGALLMAVLLLLLSGVILFIRVAALIQGA